MLQYKSCKDVELEKVYTAFRKGFSDYMIKFDMTQEDFVKRFMGPEGNRLVHSHIALEEEEPVGVILGGIKNYEGVKTLRCGALGIHPDYRGKGVSKELFRLHKEIALENGCKQMSLEVIVGNDRAIRFYSRLGYDKIYDLSYYSLPNILLQGTEDNLLDIKRINIEMVGDLLNNIEGGHINWQNDLDYIKKLEGIIHYGTFKDSELIGVLSISLSGKIFCLWTIPNYRHRGIARSGIVKAVEELKLSKLSISFPNNAALEGFVKHIGFEKDKISQYEMYLTL